MDYAIILLILSCVAVGVAGAVARTWGLHRRLYALEDRCTLLEGIQQREVKVRAAATRWQKTDQSEAMLKELVAAQPASRKLNWWETLPKTVGKG